MNSHPEEERAGEALLPVVEAIDACRIFGAGIEAVTALDGVSLAVYPGEFVALEGPSGCGKSTLLHLLGGIDLPTSGRILFGRAELATMTDDTRSELRRNRVGMVLPLVELIRTLTVWENVATPLLLAGKRLSSGRVRAEHLLDQVGLGLRANASAGRLSTGEAQRVALARALFHEPELLLADEPTSFLDSVRSDQILKLLRQLADEGQAIVMATHDPRAAAYADRSVRLLDGSVLDA